MWLKTACSLKYSLNSINGLQWCSNLILLALKESKIWFKTIGRDYRDKICKIWRQKVVLCWIFDEHILFNSSWNFDYVFHYFRGKGNLFAPSTLVFLLPLAEKRRRLFFGHRFQNLINFAGLSEKCLFFSCCVKCLFVFYELWKNFFHFPWNVIWSRLPLRRSTSLL